MAGARITGLTVEGDPDRVQDMEAVMDGLLDRMLEDFRTSAPGRSAREQLLGVLGAAHERLNRVALGRLISLGDEQPEGLHVIAVATTTTWAAGATLAFLGCPTIIPLHVQLARALNDGFQHASQDRDR